VAFLVLAALALGMLKMAPMANTDPMKSDALRAHMTGGLLILGLKVLRLIVRGSTVHPPAASTGTAALDLLARFSHAAFYALVMGMALSGLTLAVQTDVIRLLAGGHPAISPDFWAFTVRTVHYIVSRLLVALITLHLAFVLFHTFILKDGVLRRMAFGKRFATPGQS
jgi:cytochrome b561